MGLLVMRWGILGLDRTLNMKTSTKFNEGVAERKDANVSVLHPCKVPLVKLTSQLVGSNPTAICFLKINRKLFLQSF